jgi:hypothetical protein
MPRFRIKDLNYTMLLQLKIEYAIRSILKRINWFRRYPQDVGRTKTGRRHLSRPLFFSFLLPPGCISLRLLLSGSYFIGELEMGKDQSDWLEVAPAAGRPCDDAIRGAHQHERRETWLQVCGGLLLGFGRRVGRLGARELGLMCKGREQTATSFI